MDKFDRIFDLHRYFSARHTPVTIDEIAVRLECNRSTAYRLLGVLRDRLDAPIEKDPETGGFAYRTDATASRYALLGARSRVFRGDLPRPH
jgi:predicted DNA-binding transcriptional regulator YafY